MNMLWLDLLNSDYHDYRGGGKDEDRLKNRQWLKKYLDNWEALRIEPDDPAIIAQLKELRSLIRRIADNYRSGKEILKEDLKSLNIILENAPKISRIENINQEYSSREYRINPGPKAILADIVSSFAEILMQGEPERIKICQNKDCLWVFYDRSKNKSRKWCEGGTGCGNLMKVRRFRKKHKHT
jgi:predicted RNA-binding Zn ribbon-like protein